MQASFDENGISNYKFNINDYKNHTDWLDTRREYGITMVTGKTINILQNISKGEIDKGDNDYGSRI